MNFSGLDALLLVLIVLAGYLNVRLYRWMWIGDWLMLLAGEMIALFVTFFLVYFWDGLG